MKKLYVYLIVSMVIVLISCKDNTPKPIVVDDEKGLNVEVFHSAGQNWEGSDNYLPLPFNVGQVNEFEILILSERIKKGEKLNVKPLGAIQILQNDSLQTYVVSIPTASKLQTFTTDDFDEFSTVHSSVKWMVEQYLINRKNMYGVKLKSWENENFAIKYLLK